MKLLSETKKAEIRYQCRLIKKYLRTNVSVDEMATHGKYYKKCITDRVMTSFNILRCKDARYHFITACILMTDTNIGKIIFRSISGLLFHVKFSIDNDIVTFSEREKLF